MSRIRAALWPVALAAGGGALALILTSDHQDDRAVTGTLILLVGWSFVASGLVAWSRRPENRFGMLMVAEGFAWLATSLASADHALPFTVGLLVSSLPYAFFGHLLLAYPRGRLESRAARAIVVAAYLDVTVPQALWALFAEPDALGCDGCPRNLALVAASEVAAEAVSGIAQGVGVALALGAAAIYVQRWGAASAAARRALGPVLRTGGATLVLLVFVLVADFFSEEVAEVFRWFLLVALASIPLAFLAGLLRIRLAQTAVANLLVELEAVRAPGELRDALGRALGDPSLKLAYWLPEMQSYVDLRGRPIELPQGGGAQAATLVERDGRRIAALVHDAMLLDQPDLLDAVCAAASLALENERLQAEMRAHLESLRESEERMRALIEASPVAILEIDLDARITLWNPAAEAMFGWRSEEVIGRPIPIIPEELREEAEAMRAHIRAGNALVNVESVRRRKDGVLLDVLISSAPVRDEAGRVVRHMGAVVDITQRKRAEDELRRMEEKDRALLNAIPDLMFRFDRSGTYLDVKAEQTADLVRPAEELLGRRMEDVLPSALAADFRKRIDRVLDDGETQAYEYRLELDGVPRDFEARLVRSGEDEVLSIVREITERKRAEAELRRLHAELEARLEELKASRARIVEAGDAERRRLERNLHDGAQQRLVSLSLALRLAQSQLRTNPAEVERLLRGASDELAQALQELRELARGIHPAILTDRGLAPALEALAARSPVRVDVEIGFAERLPGPVEAAAYYIVAEAIANVTKYAGATQVSVSVIREDGRALVEVADDGVGGADPAAGSGLRGLADRVEALDGRLELASPPGRGTTIRAEIPLTG